jgi:crotonobetainyl-CoA:carnitine CoA-transferase CaiB-like acyl-CoA transferase
MPGPLAGIKVFELSQIVAAPYCGLNLVDLGADVIKVEPPDGEGFRHLGAFMPGESKTFHTLNRGKRSLTLNLKVPAAQELVQRVIPGFDVFIMNSRPGVAERLGVDYETLSRIRPDLVYLENTGYGDRGPGARRSGSDIAAQAYSGLMLGEGKLDEWGGPDLITSTAMADYATGLAAAMGIAAALFRRSVDGEGEYIQSSLLASALSLQNQRITRIPVADELRERPLLEALQAVRGRGGSYRELVEAREQALRGQNKAFRLYYRSYQAKDGAITLGALTRQNQDQIREVLGITDDPTADPDFNALDTSLDPLVEEVGARIREIMRTRTVAEWVERFDAAGAPAAQVNVPEEMADDPQARALEMIIDVEHELVGPEQHVGPILQLRHHPTENRRPSPPLGRHTDEVLGELGLTDVEIAELRQAGAVT